MSNIKELFEERNRLYKEGTDSILQSMSHVIDGVLIALDEDAGSEVTWEDAQIVPEDNVIVLIGFIQLSPGEVVTLDTGKTISVTEENTETFRRILRVGIPLDMAETGTTEEITEYFIQRKEKNYESIEEMADAAEHVHKQAVTAITGFDTEGLTDDQISQILQNIDKDKVH